MYLCTKNKVPVGQGFQKSGQGRRTHRQTDEAERINTPHSRVVIRYWTTPSDRNCKTLRAASFSLLHGTTQKIGETQLKRKVDKHHKSK